MKVKEIGYGKRNTTWGDYKRFQLWWTCPKAARKVIASPAFHTYPGYIQESFKERVKLEEQLASHLEEYHSDYPPKIGLPRGMEFLPTSHLQGEERKTADFIIKNKLIAVVVEKGDRDKVKVPPGFLTTLSFKPLTEIPKK